MTRTQQQFLELLRSGLWGTPADPSLFQQESTDWKSILKTAKEQTVLVIVADGIETLPKELWPSKETMLKLMMTRVKTAQMHHLLNSTLNQIVNVLDKKGIPSVLLKGQGVAQNYRNPESRTCGDIDLYVGIENYERACKIIHDLNKEPQEDIPESGHHKHLELNGVVIEVHKLADPMSSKKQSACFQKWTKDSIDNLFTTNRLKVWNNDGTSIRLALPTFDAFFILHHAVRHMTTEGIGFRHICDWTMYLHRNHSEINKNELQHYLKLFNMEQIWQEFGIIAVNILGLPQTEVPLLKESSQSAKTERILCQIFISGNFGRFDPNGRNFKKTTYLKRKWNSFRFQISRLFRFFNLFPSYTLAYASRWITGGIGRLIRLK